MVIMGTYGMLIRSCSSASLSRDGLDERRSDHCFSTMARPNVLLVAL